MTSLHGLFFLFLDHFWKNIRTFAYENRTIFELFFVMLYAFEQVALIWFTFSSNNLEELSYIVSIFAVIVLTTFAIHKLLMESIIKSLQKEVQEMQRKKLELEVKNKEKDHLYEELFDKNYKHLYIPFDFYNSKR